MSQEKIRTLDPDELFEQQITRIKDLSQMLRNLCDTYDSGNAQEMDKLIYQARALLDDNP